MFPIIINDINPALFSISFIEIRYYSLAYIVAILYTYYFLKQEIRKNNIFANKKDNINYNEIMDNFLNYSIIAIILGGRIGYILFYNFSYYISNPLEIIMIYKGGMSFHGGLIGCIIAMILLAKKYNIEFLKLTDIIIIPSSLGLFFGRIANFINMELYGRETNSNFGVIYKIIDNKIRHPSQLYEAFFEGLLPYIIFMILYFKYKIHITYKGLLSYLFLFNYSLSRIIIENFRQPDAHIGLYFNLISLGQLLTMPFLIFSLYQLLKINKVIIK